jgi:hypothetical protein
MAKTPQEIARAGFSVVLPGSLYAHTVQVIAELATQARTDEEQRVLIELQHSLVVLATPVSAKFRAKNSA